MSHSDIRGDTHTEKWSGKNREKIRGWERERIYSFVYLLENHYHIESIKYPISCLLAHRKSDNAMENNRENSNNNTNDDDSTNRIAFGSIGNAVCFECASDRAIFKKISIDSDGISDGSVCVFGMRNIVRPSTCCNSMLKSFQFQLNFSLVYLFSDSHLSNGKQPRSGQNLYCLFATIIWFYFPI